MIQRIEAGPRMSEATVHNGVVYCAGQVPETGGADIGVQTREVLDATMRCSRRPGPTGPASCRHRWCWRTLPTSPA